VVTAIKRQVTIQPGGVIEVRSPDLPAGARAEVIILLERSATQSPETTGNSPADAADAWERLRRHAGIFDGGDPHASDNDRIDADLAREYGSTPEESPG
jgi:hypothetical protein